MYRALRFTIAANSALFMLEMIFDRISCIMRLFELQNLAYRLMLGFHLSAQA